MPGASRVALPPPSNCTTGLAGKEEVAGTESVPPTMMVGFEAVSSDAEAAFVKELSKSTVVAVGRDIVPLLITEPVTLKLEHADEDIVPLFVKVPSSVKVAAPEPMVMVPLLVRE